MGLLSNLINPSKGFDGEKKAALGGEADDEVVDIADLINMGPKSPPETAGHPRTGNPPRGGGGSSTHCSFGAHGQARRHRLFQGPPIAVYHGQFGPRQQASFNVRYFARFGEEQISIFSPMSTPTRRLVKSRKLSPAARRSSGSKRKRSGPTDEKHGS